METFIKMGYNLQKSYLGAMGGGGGIATYVVLDQFPQATTRCAKKTNAQGKSKAKYKSIPDNRALGSD